MNGRATDAAMIDWMIMPPAAGSRYAKTMMDDASVGVNDAGAVWRMADTRARVAVTTTW
jgi:hypothetical protein